MVFFVEPVVETLAFGQVGIFLVALIVLDLVPGPRVFRRVLPEGALTGVATAIKLTPAIFVLYLLAVRKIRAFGVAVGVGLAVTLISAAIVPQASYDFWTRLAHGDTGLGGSVIYYTNQSVMADVVRIFGLGRGSALAGLIGCAIVALAGVWAAMLWHRIGDVRLAVNLCGVAGLLASPVSWLHHFVWIVPLAVEPGRAPPRRCAFPSAARLVPCPGLDLRRLGRRVTFPPAAQRRRCRTAMELVAAPAGLGHRDPRGGADHRCHRGRAESPSDQATAARIVSVAR